MLQSQDNGIRIPIAARVNTQNVRTAAQEDFSKGGMRTITCAGKEGVDNSLRRAAWCTRDDELCSSTYTRRTGGGGGIWVTEKTKKNCFSSKKWVMGTQWALLPIAHFCSI